MYALRQALLITVVLVLALFGSWRVWRSFASDEQRIRWRLEDMVAGFNEPDVGDVVDGLAEGFRDESSGATEGEVQQILRHLFMTEIDRETKRFRLRAEVDVDALAIEVLDTEPPRATVDFAATFYRAEGGSESRWWEASMALEFEETGAGWQIVRSSKVNHYERGSLK